MVVVFQNHQRLQQITFKQLSIDRKEEMLYFDGDVNVPLMKETIRSLGFGVYEIKTLKIEGLHCGGCVSKLTKSFEGASGIDDTVVSLENHTATCKTILSDQELTEIVHHAGFSIVN